MIQKIIKTNKDEKNIKQNLTTLLNKNSIFKINKKKSATGQEIGHVVLIGNGVTKSIGVVSFLINVEATQESIKFFNTRLGLFLLVIFVGIFFVLVYFRHEEEIKKLLLKNLSIKQKIRVEQLRKKMSFWKIFSFSTGLVLAFFVTDFLIATYFFYQKDVLFRAPSGFGIFKNMDLFPIVFVIILSKMIIFFTIRHLVDYIKTSVPGTEKRKKIALYVLLAFNLLTIPLKLPLIGSFYNYLKGKEILCQNPFQGIFSRILTSKERIKFYEETVQNFLEKTRNTKATENSLKNGAIDHMKSMLKEYDAGSASATEALLKKLEIQKEILWKEESKNYPKIYEVVKDPQEGGPGIVDKFNFQTTDPKICLFVGAVSIVGAAACAYMLFCAVHYGITRNQIGFGTQGMNEDISAKLGDMNNQIQVNTKTIQKQAEDIGYLKDNVRIMDLYTIPEIHDKIYKVSETQVTTMKQEIITGNEEQIAALQEQIRALDIKVMTLVEFIRTHLGF